MYYLQNMVHCGQQFVCQCEYFCTEKVVFITVMQLDSSHSSHVTATQDSL